MIGTLVQHELEQLIRAKDWAGLRDAVTHLNPADVAEILVDVPDEDDAAIFRVLPREAAAQVFSYLPLDHQENLVQTLTHDQMRGVLAGMTPDDQARLLGELPAAVTRRIVETLPPEELKAARDLLGYPEGPAGRYMTPRYVALRPDMTARKSLRHVKETGRGQETLKHVVDQDGRLLNDVKLGSLVLAADDEKVIDIHDTPLVAVRATDAADDVVAAFQRYDRSALPVTDADGRMLGIITADDVLDVAQRRATEEIQ
jgi:magnesium transporter